MEIMYKRNGIFEEKIVESRKYKGMKNDKNWPHENNVQHLKKIYRVLSTVQFAREAQKTKNLLIYHHIVFYIFTVPLSSLVLWLLRIYFT